jgi:hypothetical protein
MEYVSTALKTQRPMSYAINVVKSYYLMGTVPIAWAVVMRMTFLL